MTCQAMQSAADGVPTGLRSYVCFFLKREPGKRSTANLMDTTSESLRFEHAALKNNMLYSASFDTRFWSEVSTLLGTKR